MLICNATIINKNHLGTWVMQENPVNNWQKPEGDTYEKY